MSVAVISKTGEKLMPTSEYRARKLLKSGKAIKHSYRPFTIQLTEMETGDVQPIELCMDTGYIHIEISVKSEKHEYLAEQIDTLTDERTRHDACRMYRTQRRGRKRYRHTRFNNRKRDKGWIAPSLEHKKNIHIQAISRISKVMPVTDITMEMGNFDTQVLKAKEEGKPLPQGTDYQHGERYGIATLREAVFARDGYKCQCCGRTIKDGAILHVHHVKYRSHGGTNSMSNLATVCDKCHTPKNHKPGGKLYNWKPKLPSFKGATFMTTIRWQLYNEVKALFPDIDIHITYGAMTKRRRRELDIDKSHVNDAFAMGCFHPKHRVKAVLYKKKRRNNRCIESFYDAKYIDSRDGKKRSGQELFNGRINRNHKKDSENLHKYRLQKITDGKRTVRKQHYNIQPHDIIVYESRKHETAGCHCNGARVMILPDKKSVSIKKSKYTNMLAVILNQHLIKKERAVKMQKQRIPPNPTTKQEILSLRRMGFPAQKKMEHMEKEIYARQKNLRKSNKQMAANHIWMPPPSRPFILLSRSSVSNMCKMHRRARRNNFKHFTVLVLAPFINCSCCYDDTDDYRRFHTTIDII